MNEPKIYSFDSSLLPDANPKDGFCVDLVRVGDYASLKADRDALADRVNVLAVENAAIKAMNDCLSEELRGYESDGAFEGPNMHHMWWKAETPATSEALAAIRDKHRAEGINFSANRLLAAFEHGFIDKPAGEVADVAKMILSAVTELPGAPEEDFTRDYSDEVIALIRAELREAK